MWGQPPSAVQSSAARLLPSYFKFVILSETVFVSRRTQARRVMCRILCDTIIARLARFLIAVMPYGSHQNTAPFSIAGSL
jgi:hypothetical protein